MMYLTICKKDFNEIQIGELFETYQKFNYAYIRPKGGKSDFISIPFLEFQSYFKPFEDHMVLPIQEIIYEGFFRKKQIIKKKEEYITFNDMEFEDLLAMQLPIIYQIKKLSKIESFYKHTKSIHSSLMELKSSLDVPFNNYDFKQQINNIASLVDEAQNTLKKEMNN